MNIYKKLMDARLKLQSTRLSKSGHNKFAGYLYFELGDFLPTVQTIFAEIGLCGVVSFSADIATLTIYETDGDGSIAFTSPMGSANLKGCHEVQNVGAVETYQRRYLWVTAMEIVEHDALDAGTVKDEPKKQTLDESEYADWQLKFMECTDVDTLKTEWDKCLSQCKELGDRSSAERLKKVMMSQHQKIEGAL